LALLRAGVVGDVRVRFIAYAYADGSIGKISILQSDHPDRAEASRVAIEQWRFKPPRKYTSLLPVEIRKLL
jgi:outer membrane biosynthesis protein TonB